MLSLPLSLLTLAATALAADPAPPKLTYLYSANLTFAAPITIGSVPSGSRNLLTISGGTVKGPKINGTPPGSPFKTPLPPGCTDVGTGKIGSGVDWGLTDSKGVFSPDALYTLHTDDNATVLVFEKGHAPNVQILFETASEKYAWLNSAVGYASGGPNDVGIGLDVWQVSLFLSLVLEGWGGWLGGCVRAVLTGCRLGLEDEDGGERRPEERVL